MLRFKWLVLGALLAAVLTAAFGIRYVLQRPGEIARALSGAMAERLGLRPAIYIRDYVVVEEKKPISELALVSRDIDIGHNVESVLLGSKARLDLRAAYRVKAGFDLRAAEFSLRLDAGRKEARLDLPAPRVLSVEMIHYEVLADRRGWWNRISEDQKALAMRELQARARLEAIRAGILGESRTRMDEELAAVSVRAGVKVVARYRMDADTAAPRLETAPAPR